MEVNSINYGERRYGCVDKYYVDQQSDPKHAPVPEYIGLRRVGVFLPPIFWFCMRNGV